MRTGNIAAQEKKYARRQCEMNVPSAAKSMLATADATAHVRRPVSGRTQNGGTALEAPFQNVVTMGAAWNALDRLKSSRSSGLPLQRAPADRASATGLQIQGAGLQSELFSGAGANDLAAQGSPRAFC